MESDKIICAAWIGRFGNRCHSYLYGKHIEDKFKQKFYVAQTWEGSVLFKNSAPVTPSEFSKISFAYGGGSEKLPSFARNKSKLTEYNKTYSDSIELIDPTLEKNYRKSNTAFINLTTDSNWFYEKVSIQDIRRYFEFTDEVKQSDMYKELEDLQGTYDAAHFRRTDISRPHYKGGHSMVSKKSYYDAIKKYDTSEEELVWLSDEPKLGWKYNKKIPTIGGKVISWLPDFIKMMFARKLYRSNSSFSLWAGWLGSCEVFSPWLHEYAPGKEKDFKFVEGNHPHWMSVEGIHASYHFLLKGEQMDNKTKNIKRKSNIIDSQKLSKEKAVMVHWNGRFGNRVFSYMFGKSYCDKNNIDFYLPSEWEGTRLFKNTGDKIIPNDKLRLQLNQSKKPMDSIEYRTNAIDEYNKEYNDNIVFKNPDSFDASNFNCRNFFFDSLCIHSSNLFKSYNKSKILKWLQFSDEVKNLDIYKRLEDKQGTYDIAHLRRDDISNANYNKNHVQAYSVVSKQSYLNAFTKFGFDANEMQWTTDDWTGKWGVGKPTIRGGWSYPVGSNVIPDIMFDWLPDFLRLYFARTIFRGNSSFSWVAAFLSPTANVFSPVLTQRKTYRNSDDEILFDFVEGNEPHWMNLKGSHCDTIEIL